MNRELRRLQEKEEKRAKDRRAQMMAQRRRKERVGIRQFVSEVRTELRRVAWPGRREVVTFTLVTLITSGAVTLFTLGLDIGFKEGILALLELR
ncbi:MAG TPA: preprotein translocase subunit SecE [Acidimicrobiia bacterium]|nr:preprotein translocase subunit SecE [Acidimicrobiia bacterium]